MTIEPYIMNDIPIQSIHGKIADMLELFDQFPHSHIPIEKNGNFVGCLSENDARSFESSKTIGDYLYALENFSVHEEDAWLSVLEIFAQNRTTLMPVLNAEKHYVGYVELNDVIGLFNIIPFLSEPGGILVVEKGFTDYSFSEICQIVESNSGKILGLFISRIKNEMAQITLKIGSSGLNEIIQSFRRYGYKIVSHHQEDVYRENLKERSEYLQKYLGI